ncbi:MAG: B12-binding domain-containing radical SAM protein [Candidatus Omnitrophica bacterium]|nr:B12-binding domain-containing radical SAM protein [Candidatus Omnitrophota bacterium]
MNVTLLNPPSPFLLKQKAFPPLGLLYLVSALKNDGINVQLVDLANRENAIEQELEGLNSQIYGITATTPQYPWAKRIREVIKQRNPHTPVIIGGAHPSSAPEVCLNDGFDVVVVGEGERSFFKIVKDFRKNKNINKGLIKSEYIENIDTIKYPDRTSLDLKSYAYDIAGSSATTIITSRGCPYSCAFCSKDVWSNKVRYHSVEYVIGELKQIIEKWGFKYFLFLDDSFALNRKRSEKLFNALKPLGIRWRCYLRSDHVTRELLEEMKSAGCIEVGIGAESGSQKVLDKVNKGLNVEENAKVVKWCKELGIITNVFLMIGLPGETYETVKETKEWFKRVRPDKFGFNIFYPYVGTPIYINNAKFGITIHELSDEHSWVKGRKGEYQAFISTEELSREDILQLHTELFEYFIKLTGWRTDWEGKD